MRTRIFVTGVGILFLVTMGWILCAGIQIRRPPDPTRVTMALLAVAAEGFRADTGAYPIGNNAEFTRVLLGNNPRQKSYLHINMKYLLPDGLIVDEWGTAICITGSANKYDFQSAGPDKLFGDKDDLNTSSE